MKKGQGGSSHASHFCKAAYPVVRMLTHFPEMFVCTNSSGQAMFRVFLDDRAACLVVEGECVCVYMC